MPHIVYVAKREGDRVSVGYQDEFGVSELKYDLERRAREADTDTRYEITQVVVWEIPRWLQKFIK